MKFDVLSKDVTAVWANLSPEKSLKELNSSSEEKFLLLKLQNEVTKKPTLWNTFHQLA